jgi:hypothetical protein
MEVLRAVYIGSTSIRCAPLPGSLPFFCTGVECDCVGADLAGADEGGGDPEPCRSALVTVVVMFAGVE